MMEKGARGTMLSVPLLMQGQHQDTGAKMIHSNHILARLVSKSIEARRGKVDYRGQVTLTKTLKSLPTHIECDTIIMDDLSASDTIPFMKFTTRK